MARTGCASGAAISACGTARNQFRARQVLPAYGLQSWPPIHFQELTKVLFRTIPGGHFNMAENRTFLLCVDTTETETSWQSPGNTSFLSSAKNEGRSAINRVQCRALNRKHPP